LSLADDVFRIKLQEERLRFSKFDEADAWTLGTLMRNRAEQKKLPLVIDIRASGRRLFCTALPGTTPDNDEWVRRKINVVMQFHASSYRKGLELAQKGSELSLANGYDPANYAAHGGCFPIMIENSGIVGTVTVSGIPQREDHNFVVECLCEFLKIPYTEIALGAETA
jgi:uncharacterized protein (UPF0303 family)